LLTQSQRKSATEHSPLLLLCPWIISLFCARPTLRANSFKALNYAVKGGGKDDSPSCPATMEKAMRALLTLIASLAAIGSSAAAQPPKRAPVKPQPQPQRSTELALASADAAHRTSPPVTTPAPAPVNKPVPRITTCRCGDPQSGPSSDEQ
jgi:hypothetical protein